MVVTNPEAFDATKFTVWDATAKGYGATLLSLLHTMPLSSDCDRRVYSLSKSMVQHDKWSGCMTKLGEEIMAAATSKEMLATLPFEGDPVWLDSPGAVPWLTCSRSNAWRFGPQAFPMVGFGAVAKVVGTVPMCIGASEVNALVGQGGICISDLGTFLETDAGNMYMQSSMVVFHLPAEGVAWLPYGWVACTLCLGEGVKCDELGFLIFWRMCLPKCKDAMPEAARIALRSWNRDYMATEKTKSSREAKAAPFDKFVG